VKKASLFTRRSALFEGLDDNPKSSALQATERAFKHITASRSSLLVTEANTEVRVFTEVTTGKTNKQTKRQLNQMKRHVSELVKAVRLIFPLLSRLRSLSAGEENERRKNR